MLAIADDLAHREPSGPLAGAGRAALDARFRAVGGSRSRRGFACDAPGSAA